MAPTKGINQTELSKDQIPAPGHGEGPASLYIHIPFCHTKCPYCAFNSQTNADRNALANYLAALKKEIKLMAENPWVRGRDFATLFIGGGTPTIFSAEQLIELLELCYTNFSFILDSGSNHEATIEMNPNTASLEKLKSLNKSGFNRLSIGIQSFSDKQLRTIGRSHTKKEGINAVHLSRKAGFTNINLDLMYGLPEQRPVNWEKTLKTALSLNPEHLSIYQLSLEEHTPFADLHGKNLLHLPNDNVVYEMDMLTRELTAGQGYEHYEISNYSRPGYKCRHNINYWENGSYLGLGAGAVSCFSGLRIKNTSSPDIYIQRLTEGKTPFDDGECLSREGRFRESIIMGMRMTDGVSCRELEMRFALSPLSYYGNILDDLVKEDMVAFNGDRMHLTSKGLTLANQVLSKLV